MKPLAALILSAALAGCGDNNARFEIAPTVATAEASLRVGSIEVRDVSLPAYAAASEIVAEDADGALRPLEKAVWADDPGRAVTGALARSLDLKSTATVAAEPWPLADDPDLRLDLRIDQMIARANGSFEMTGQYALASPNGTARETIQRFAINVPLVNTAPATVATAAGAAIDRLADEIIALHSRATCAYVESRDSPEGLTVIHPFQEDHAMPAPLSLDIRR
ncbi:MAG: membrane integrity-associated transporter subunit PqiC, partial [Tabrizicola sp.]|nr:membrane integrity-associated transporter subunit PqiC [Tabrizicola sp.]